MRARLALMAMALAAAPLVPALAAWNEADAKAAQEAITGNGS